MVIAATLIMIINTTFRIPYGLWAVYGLAWSRESTRATVRAVKKSIVTFPLAAGYVIIGRCFPWTTHAPLAVVDWHVVSRILRHRHDNGLRHSRRLGHFDRPESSALGSAYFCRAEGGNNALGGRSSNIASLITATVALVFEELGLGDDLLRSIGERLACVENLLDCYAESRPADEKITKQITRMAVLGTSTLRSNLQRSNYSPLYAEQMGAIAALVGRLVDTAASLSNLSVQMSTEARARIRLLTENVGGIRADLLASRTPHLRKTPPELDSLSQAPMLQEMEKTVSLIADVFIGSQSLGAYSAPASSIGDPGQTLFVRDALSNPEHVKFALKGCLAASLCYIIYSSLDWPGISTSVTTCMLTALTTIGASHQKQVLRFTGAMVGGAIGIASQVFVLPEVDSIFGFTLLFLAVTIVAAWIATSGPRLSYFGLQLAAAFYFVNLDQFKSRRRWFPPGIVSSASCWAYR